MSAFDKVEEVERWAELYPENSVYHSWFHGIAREMRKRVALTLPSKEESSW